MRNVTDVLAASREAVGHQDTIADEAIAAHPGPGERPSWWFNDPTHNAVIYNTSITEIGAGYAYIEDSADGNYYTVNFGSQ